MLSHHPLITASDRLYFAYGSNLSPEQMAHRCPDSIFLGKGTLRGHRWQINERGVANVVPTGRRRDLVEGLVYAVSAADERRLDRHEGVERGRRERSAREVDFEPVRDNVFARCTSASVAKVVREERGREREQQQQQQQQRQRSGRKPGPRGDDHRASLSSAASASGGWTSSILGLLGVPPMRSGRARSPSPTRGRRGGRERARSADGGRAVRSKPVVALVYASTAHGREGDVRPGYVPRIERAMADAMALGVSRGFVEGHMAPQVWRSKSNWRSSWSMSLAGGEEGPGTGRRAMEVANGTSVSQPDGPGRRGRRDSVVMDRHRDY
ncbi:hypothetical protein diail_11699 [Diaporthe ilicicola]|nr:hypothetical protein diail_11699 [Diaporthe ilicicola]